MNQFFNIETVIILILLVSLVVTLKLLFNFKSTIRSINRAISAKAEDNDLIADTLSFLSEYSSDFLFQYNAYGMITYVSNSVESVLGHPHSEFIGRVDKHLSDNEINRKYLAHTEAVFKDGLTSKDPLYVEMLNSSGEPQMIQLTEKVYLNKRKEVRHVSVLAKNVTNVFKVEMELKESERQQSQILKSLPDAMFTIDREFKYLDYQSPAYEELWYDPSDFIGKRISDIVPDPLGKELEGMVSASFNSEDVLTYEYSFNPDGKEEHYETRFVKLDEEKILVIARNITAQKQLQEGLRRAKEAAEAATEARTNFLATMSHEIRTPMNGVIGMTSLLAQTTLSEEQKDYLETIQASSDSLMRIINDILDFSKIESGNMAFEESVFSLTKLLDDCINLVQYEAQEKGVVISKDIDSEVHDFYASDKARLKQIILNLLSNAVKFTEKGIVSIVVSKVNFVGNLYELKIAIKDTGIGIPKDKIPTLFKEFTQVDSSHNRKFGGTGLGLTIVKNLVKLFGGKVYVKSKEGVGSEFIFTLKLKSAEKPKDVDGIVDLVEMTTISSEFPLKILLAEDNAVNRKLTSLFLEKLGYLPDLALDGLEVMEKIKNSNYDVLLLDISMPNMNGYEVAKAIKQLEIKNPPYIIGVSANAFKSDVEKALNSGMHDYITKPVRFEELKSKLITAGKSKSIIQS